jgi:uncharacterized membrane protein
MQSFFKFLLLFFLIYTFYFLTASFLAPVSAFFKHYEIADFLYYSLSASCHQQPSKSFWILGYPMGVCSRCLGIYISVFLVLCFYLYKNFLISNKLLLFTVSTFVIGFLLKYLEIDSFINNYIRLISGVFIGCFMIVVLLKGKEFLSMKIFKKMNVCLLICSFVLATLPVNANVNNEGLLNFINQHKGKKVVIEYQYSTINKLASNNSIYIPAGLPIIIRTTETITSDNDITSGENINFTVVNDVIVNGKIVIKAGTSAKAQISTFQENNFVGIPAKIVITDFSTTSVDNRYIPLRATLSQKGSDRIVLAAVLTIACLPFALIKGGEAVIPAGYEKTVYTATEIRL